MNIFEARKILDLSENWTDEELKKSYRAMAMKYHPDKCKTPDSSEKFIKIKQAYEFLNKGPQENVEDILSNLFKSFTTSFRVPQNFKMPRTSLFTKEIEITPKEYFTGTSRQIKTPINCSCEQSICNNCAGCGYSNVLVMETCMECTGTGSMKICDCELFQIINIIIQPYANLNAINQFKIKINDPKYIFLNNKMYYRIDITLKESLVGFTKTFKDPFGDPHEVSIQNTIIKQNDGYTLSNLNLTLLFNIIYPKKLKKDTKKIIKNLDF
jgi:DnaJ-class molecular chaperone